MLNSPIANGYAYSHLGKRDNIVGDLRKIPLPTTRSFEGVDSAATAYLAAASSKADSATLKKLLLQVDSEVLKVYSLPVALEQALLALFTSWERVGVPFKQTRYLPVEVEGSICFSDFLELEKDWSVTNRERGMLIDKSISGMLNTEERRRLDALQIYADYHLDQVSPRPTDVLDELEKRLFSGMPKKNGDVS